MAETVRFDGATQSAVKVHVELVFRVNVLDMR
jgi:hypothetical protein